MPLLLASTLLPGLVRTAVAEVQAEGQARPDLAVLEVRVRGAEEPVGRPRVVEVAVANRGLAPASAPVEVLVEPPLGFAEAPEALAAAGGGAASSATLALGPGAVRTTTFQWTPRHAGGHTLVARIDPHAAVLEAGRDDNVLARPAEVPPLPFPDLHATLTLGDAEPVAGLPSEVFIEVRNVGPVAARGVQVEVRAGVESVLEPSPFPVGDLGPGEVWNLTRAWVPGVPGNATIVATAFAREGAPEPVATLGDNAAIVAARIREESTRVRAVPRNASTAASASAEGPGGVLAADFQVSNAGNANETYRLRAEVPPGWAHSILVAGKHTALLLLAPGGSATVQLELLPPAAEQGAAKGTSLALLASPASTGREHRGEALLRPPPREGLVVSLAEVDVRPSDPALVLDLRNDGTAPATWQVRRAQLPDTWTLLGASAEIPAGATRRVRLDLGLGGDAAPRSVPFALDWAAGSLEGRVGGGLRVLPEARLVAAGEAAAPAGGQGQANLTLRNHGNVAWEGLLRWEAPAGFALDREIHALRVEPGVEHALTFRVEAPLAATASPTILRASFVPQATAGTRSPAEESAPTGDPAALAIPLRVALADLAVESLRRAPEAPAPGERVRYVLGVTNRGSAPLHGVAAELYADGVLVAAQPLGDLPPGAVADAELTWTMESGTHTLTVAAVHRSGLLDARPEDNARSETLTAQGFLEALLGGLQGPLVAGAGLVALAGAGSVLAARRRSLGPGPGRRSP